MVIIQNLMSTVIHIFDDYNVTMKEQVLIIWRFQMCICSSVPMTMHFYILIKLLEVQNSFLKVSIVSVRKAV